MHLSIPRRHCPLISSTTSPTTLGKFAAAGRDFGDGGGGSVCIIEDDFSIFQTTPGSTGPRSGLWPPPRGVGAGCPEGFSSHFSDNFGWSRKSELFGGKMCNCTFFRWNIFFNDLGHLCNYQMKQTEILDLNHGSCDTWNTERMCRLKKFFFYFANSAHAWLFIKFGCSKFWENFL